MQAAQKENTDLKYDNTLLYEKNVDKDEKLFLSQEQVAKFKK